MPFRFILTKEIFYAFTQLWVLWNNSTSHSIHFTAFFRINGWQNATRQRHVTLICSRRQALCLKEPTSNDAKATSKQHQETAGVLSKFQRSIYPSRKPSTFLQGCSQDQQWQDQDQVQDRSSQDQDQDQDQDLSCQDQVQDRSSQDQDQDQDRSSQD